jgi:putative ABC transport system permease protein
MSKGAAWRRLLARARGLFSRRDDADFEREIDEHFRLLIDRYVRGGMTQEEATTAARRQFGNTTLLREERWEMQTFPTVEALWSDCRHTVRMVAKSPGFASAIVLTLALGIGANTAIFSICNAVLLKPLPYADPDRLMMLWEQLPDNGELITVAPANFVDWREQTSSFAGVVAINPTSSLIMSGTGEPARLSAAGVSWDFFTVLGTPPVLGRGFLAEEDQPGRNRVAILSHRTWVERFGAAADVVGRTTSLNEIPYTIVGVLPRDFELLGRSSDQWSRDRFDVWVPLALAASPSRGTHPLRVVARLKPEADLGEAQAELDLLGARLAAAYPDENKGKGIRAVSLRQQVTAEVRAQLVILLGAVVFVLAIACANVANLMLSRSAARQKETSVRLAIGATRARIAQQFVVESALLGLAGGAVGLALATGVMGVAVPYLPLDIPRTSAISLDWRVLLFTAGASLTTGILFGLVPLFHSRRVQAQQSLVHGARVAGGGQTRLRGALVAAQVAITLVLLVGAGLMMRSLWTLLHVPTGFRSDHVLTARITLPRARYADAGRVAAFQRQLFERVRGIPGVERAGAGAYLPLSGDDNGWAFFIDGRSPKPVGVYDFAKYRAVSDGYFDAIGTAVVRGREFRSSDDQEAPFVAVINQAMAGKFWSGQDAVGERIRFGGRQWRTIVGVVGDVRHEGLAGEPKPEMYVPFGQAPNVETSSRLVVRAAIDPMSTTSAVRAAVAAVDPAVPLDQIRTMDELVSSAAGQPRFRALLLTALSILALLMASIGIYGVTNYAVVQRTRELGICMALGATAGDVLRSVMNRSARLILMGFAVGLAASVALTRVIAGWLFGVAPLDVLTFATVSLLLCAVAFLATYIPARRATRIDPVRALRYE